jgi:putative selenium metabolism hydrolase
MLTKEREDKLVQLCSDLVRTKSYSGKEAQIAGQLKRIFEQGGCSDVTIDEYGSITVRFKGKRPGKTLLLDAHIDTVPVTDPSKWQMDPFGGEVQDGRIYGRGASDMKGALSAMIAAVEYFIADTNNDFDGEIILAGVVQEEAFEGVASRSISKRFKPDCVVIGEASNLNLNHGQRGRAEIVVETFGKPAHSANPKAGLNAVYKMSKLIDAIRRLPTGRHPVLGDGILELTDIQSSPYPGLSVVPEYCIATYDRRLLIGETKENVLAPILDLIAAFEGEDPDFKAEASYAVGKETCYTDTPIQAERFFPAWIYDEDDDFIQTAFRGLNEVGLDPKISHYSFCTNASHYAGEAGIKTIGFGPSEECQAHVNNEYIEISHLFDACRGYYGILNAVLNGNMPL